MKDNPESPVEPIIKKPPIGLAAFALVGPSMVWAAEYIGSGEVIVATRTGAILGSSILWALVLGVFLKFWIGMSGARYTVCTGEGMIDMFDRIPGPKHWAVWIVLVAQFAAAAFSIGALATAAGVFINSIMKRTPGKFLSVVLFEDCIFIYEEIGHDAKAESFLRDMGNAIVVNFSR